MPLQSSDGACVENTNRQVGKVHPRTSARHYVFGGSDVIAVRKRSAGCSGRDDQIGCSVKDAICLK